MPRSVVGLEITSRRLLAVEVEGATGKQPTLVRAHQFELPPEAARDSEVNEPAEISQALRLFWREAGFRSKRVVLGVGNQRVLVRDHTVPVMPLGQLHQALPFQVADLLPVPVEETILDFYPIEPVADSAPPTMRGLLVAALRDAVETDVAAVEDAGLRVVGVDLSPFALVRALTPSGVLQGTHTVVMIGARTTHIVVVRDAVPRFVRIVPTGGETLTDAAEAVMGSGREDAEAMKQRVGIEGVDHPQYGAVSKAMFDALRGIFGSVRNTNSYYLSNEQENAIDSVILLGTEARVPGIARAVAENVGLPVRLGSPVEGITVSGQIDTAALNAIEPDLTVPIGLALRSV